MLGSVKSGYRDLKVASTDWAERGPAASTRIGDLQMLWSPYRKQSCAFLTNMPA